MRHSLEGQHPSMPISVYMRELLIIAFANHSFYPYSRTNPELVQETWHHPSLPRIQQWLQALQTLGLIEEAELPALEAC